MLELDLENALIGKEGYVLCHSYFSSGESSLQMTLAASNVESIQIGISLYKCTHLNLCTIYFYIEGQAFRLKYEISTNCWIYLCMSFDLLKQEISLGIANNSVFRHKLEDSQIKAPADVQKISIWWEDEIFGVRFPEKITLINIHSNDRKVDKFKCGEPGDIYSWKMEGWKSGKQNLALLTSLESNYQTCQSIFQIHILPKLYFYDALKMCKNILGSMYYEDTVFEELTYLKGNKKPFTELGFWIPYTDEKGEGVFRNVYSNSTFKNITEYFMLGQPNGKGYENCLNFKLRSAGLWDSTCLENYFSLCKIPKSSPYMTLRGLCQESLVERSFTPGNIDGKFIWKGHRHASIQYTDRWFLNDRISNDIWGESEASYDSLLIGTHVWTIYNDKRCFNKVYTANLSLRLNSYYYILINLDL